MYNPPTFENFGRASAYNWYQTLIKPSCLSVRSFSEGGGDINKNYK